ncbi:hypothetical protein EGI26_14880 [Lacihabitans sp. CCS-44]|uniref:hypothetical protein n=1 Tax=Lacihabitans sp. CCS-44 TaxID=2487331 RepID=UPI0020CFD17F|nr:hypothetical protein [Lacihabitans sp. CCS-44]MCP9756447.1 hypothetical protein [Lacihabitans sp. CCS-44]
MSKKRPLACSEVYCFSFRGKWNKRFYNVLEEKYNLIIDLYDFDKYKSKGNSNYYHSKNRFSLEKAEEFKSDGYI